MIEIASDISFALLGVGVALTLWRLVRGPHLADRVLALDMLTMLGIGVIATFAVRTATSLYIDIAITLALLGFVATAAFARFLLERRAE
ncbi:MAG TPA: monovalent cation/H+ antiporter complex subunit F [Devosia sp.]|jgi:multicomponent Na+:H+ antiporter subunit F|nr:monovalent cation/H+ antiporter complex subunit F [Devosia sp.]